MDQQHLKLFTKLTQIRDRTRKIKLNIEWDLWLQDFYLEVVDDSLPVSFVTKSNNNFLPPNGMHI